MTVNQILTKDFQFINNWTNSLITDLNESQWMQTLPEIGTNIHWIAGHILHDNYWHSIGWVTQPSNEFQKNFDISRFEKYFKKGSNPLIFIEERPSRGEILESLSLLNAEILKIVKNITRDELEQKTLISSPVAKNKYESLSFAVKHQMLHNGQIAMIKRILKYV